MPSQNNSHFFTKDSALPYIYLLLFSYIVYLFMMPIRMGDTDMWYHLNGGRFFWENLSIPTTPFFSFIEPQQEWTNYYWGFQAIIFKIFDLAGYQGLAILRSVLGASTVLMLFTLFTKNRGEKNAVILFLLLAVFIIIYDGRVYQLRPHLFSYLFITIFLYILQYRPNLTPLLPILTIPWANIHGVEWPVPALICGGYALPVVIKLVRNENTGLERPYLYLVSIFLCAPVFLINPYGWELFLAPFNIDKDTYQYIGELTSLDDKALTTIQINGTVIPLHTAMTLLFLLSSWAFIALTFKKQLPLSAGILFIGGLFLLFRGSRFVWEWLLLCIPVVSYLLIKPLPVFFTLTKGRLPLHLALSIIIIMTGSTLYQKAKHFGSYPFDYRHLPTGIGDFVQKTNATGHVLAPPSIAGYVEWKLHPNIKTFIDMQFPPSTDMNMFKLTRAYNTEYGLKQFVKNYDIDWILMRINHQPASKNITKLSEFQPVFVDDALVLYANRDKHEELVSSYGLKAVNPHALFDKQKDREQEYINELERLLDISPQLSGINRVLAIHYLEKQQNDKALQYALEFARLSPHDPNSHYILGRVYQQLEQFEPSHASFKKALEITNKDSRAKVELAMATTHYFEQDFSAAYRLFNKTVNPYRIMHEPDTLYMYALSATIEGKLDKATRLIDMLLYSTDPDKHQDIIEQTLDIQTKIEKGEFDSISIVEWAIKLVSGNLDTAAD
jgi:hypothetical protein